MPNQHTAYGEPGALAPGGRAWHSQSAAIAVAFCHRRHGAARRKPPAHKLLAECGCRETVLVQPEKRSKRKTDRRDAATLSEIPRVNRHRLGGGERIQGIRGRQARDPRAPIVATLPGGGRRIWFRRSAAPTSG